VLPSDFVTMDKKVFYTLLLMKEGVARTWKEQYLHSRENAQHLADQYLWTNFVNTLKTSFADPSNKMTMMQTLKAIH